MFDPIVAIASVAYVFAAPVLVKILVLDRPDARESSPRKDDASSRARIGHK